MLLYKKLFGYFLIIFSLLTIIMIGFPQIYSADKSGRINKEIKVSSDFLKNETSDIVLLYFGYVGCSNVCLPSLIELDEIYKNIDNKRVAVYFVNLLDVIDKDLPNLFAISFNKNFKGVHLNKDELTKATNEFNVAYSKSLINKYELNHPGFLYLLIKDKISTGYKQKYIYTTRPFAEEIIVEDISKLLKNRS